MNEGLIGLEATTAYSSLEFLTVGFKAIIYRMLSKVTALKHNGQLEIPSVRVKRCCQISRATQDSVVINLFRAPVEVISISFSVSVSAPIQVRLPQPKTKVIRAFFHIIRNARFFE